MEAVRIPPGADSRIRQGRCGAGHSQMDWNGLMEKYSISYSTVGRYRKKAAREMDQMYEFRDDVEMKYILS